MASDQAYSLRIADLRVCYGKREVLRGATLQISPGEIVALVGVNGSGKSTLLRTVAGLLRPEAGSVVLQHGREGTNLIGLTPHRVNHLGVSYLLQGGEVFTNLSVKENLETACRLGRCCRKPRDAARAYEWFPQLRSLSGRRAGLLSGGERQMLAISMVLVQEPHVLLLDEPSAGLAAPLVARILEVVRAFCDGTRCPVLLVEQNVRQAVKIAHRVVGLLDGEIRHPGDRTTPDFHALGLIPTGVCAPPGDGYVAIRPAGQDAVSLEKKGEGK